MNLPSITIVNAASQEKSPYSWKDDPFDLKEHFTSLSMTTEAQSNNHYQNLMNFAEDLIANNATFRRGHYDLNLEDLSEYDQNELTRLYMETTNRETSECVYGDDFTIESNYTCALLDMLQNDCYETRHHFAEVTRKNVITYYAESLQGILDTACKHYLQLVNNDQGLFEVQDSETGEINWGKF